MAEKGIVTGLKANNIAVVKMTRLEACAKCRACIAGMEGKDMFIEAPLPSYFQNIIDNF